MTIPKDFASGKPMDGFNQRLLQNVRPLGWKNPEPQGRYNLAVGRRDFSKSMWTPEKAGFWVQRWWPG